MRFVPGGGSASRRIASEVDEIKLDRRTRFVLGGGSASRTMAGGVAGANLGRRTSSFVQVGRSSIFGILNRGGGEIETRSDTVEGRATALLRIEKGDPKTDFIMDHLESPTEYMATPSLSGVVLSL